MKKALSLLILAFLLIASFTVTGYAYINDMTKVTEMNVFYLEDFEGLSGAPTMPWVDRGNFTAEYSDGKLIVKENLMFQEGYGYAKIDLFRNAPSSLTGITGYGYYIENNTNVEITTRGYWIGCDAFVGYIGMPYYTMVDGVITEYYSGDANGEVYIEPGFKGYILFPWEGMNVGLWYGSDPMEVTYDTSKDWISIAFTGWSSEDGSVVLDNFILYGSTDMEGETISVSYCEEQEPTEEPTVAPTDEPTAAPEDTTTSQPEASAEATVAPTETPDGSDAGSNSTWIIIAIAAAVIIAVIVVVILARKKATK